MASSEFRRALRSPLIWIVPLQACLFFWHLSLLDEWGDEWYTEMTSVQTLPDVLGTAARMNHPPLYFVLAHFWNQLLLAGTTLTRMRAMSGVWALFATVSFYLLWLRPRSVRFQRIALTLWLLSPCLLLYARMARSYTMQLALGVIAIYATLEFVEKPNELRRLTSFVVSCALLLYTHYLPGIAVIAAAVIALLRRGRIKAIVLSGLLIGLLYLPWLLTLAGILKIWSVTESYRVGGFFADQTVRLAYWFVAFGLGEMLSPACTVIAVISAPLLFYALYRGFRRHPDWLEVVLVAAVTGYIAVSRWSGYPATASHVLFALPFFLMLMAEGIDEGFRRRFPLLLLLTIMYVSGISSYFAKSDFLNKGFAVPNRAMAATILQHSAGEKATVVLEIPFPDALIPLLGTAAKPSLIVDEESADGAHKRIQETIGRSWLCRRAHDLTDSRVVDKLEREVRQERSVTTYEFAPYNVLERWILRWLRGPGQPAYAYRCLEIE